MQPELHPILVTTSCDREDVCKKLTQVVLKHKLAACVQISAPVCSAYWWQNALAEDTEYLVTMKTDRALFDALSELIRKIHTYDVPEIIATEIVAIDETYAQWMHEMLKNNGSNDC